LTGIELLVELSNLGEVLRLNLLCQKMEAHLFILEDKSVVKIEGVFFSLFIVHD